MVKLHQGTEEDTPPKRHGAVTNIQDNIQSDSFSSIESGDQSKISKSFSSSGLEDNARSR